MLALLAAALLITGAFAADGHALAGWPALTWLSLGLAAWARRLRLHRTRRTTAATAPLTEVTPYGHWTRSDTLRHGLDRALDALLG
jgi:hypothetical protein